MALKTVIVNMEEEELDVVSITLSDGREILVFPSGEFEVWAGSNCINENLLEEDSFIAEEVLG